GVAGGQTYSEVSGAALKDPTNTKLQAQAQTLFRGETLRGLLLNVWGWATVGTIAFYTGIAAWIGALIVLFGLVLGFVMHERQMKREQEEVIIPAEERVPASV